MEYILQQLVLLISKIKRYKKVKIYVSVFLVAIMIVRADTFSFAAGKSTKHTLRVAVYNNSTLAYQDKNGVWRGTDVECLTNIAQRTNLKIKFIDSANDANFLSNLDNGTYDMVADVVKTPEREKKYLFSDKTLGTMNNTLAVRGNDDRWDYGDIEQISFMRIGVIASYANNAEFRSWCKKRNVSPQIIEYENIEDMTVALQKGNIDGEVYSTMYGKDYTKEFRTIMEFLPEEYYFIFRHDDVALKNKVDEALTQIIVDDNEYLTNLSSRYRYQFGGEKIPLSAQEKSFVAQNPTITVAVLENDEPYFSKKPDGTVCGVIPDYYKLLSAYAGLKFRYVVYATQGQAVAAINSGKSDVLGVFSSGIISASQNGLALTEKITSVSDVLLMKAGTELNDIQTVAVKKRSIDALQSMNADFFSKAHLLGLETARGCFNAVRTGKADAAVLGMPSATWLLNQTNSSLYSITSLPGMPLDLCSATRQSNTILCSILNKSIAATRENVDGIITNDTKPEDSWITSLNRVPSYTIVLIAGVLAILVIVLTWLLVLLKRRQKERVSLLAAQTEAEQKQLRAEAMQKSAERQNSFFSNISHDMRTPLNAVLGFVRLAQKDKLEPEKRGEYLEKAESSGALLLDLINDTLTLSKVSSGKLELHLEPVRARALFDSVIEPIRAEATKKNINFIVDYSKSLDRIIMIDRLNVQKIFLNLLSNAVKYTPPGGQVNLIIFNVCEDGKSPDSLLVVSDNGIGISKKFLPRIFEPFSQEKKMGYESIGTGLGLSIVKQLVDLMGGSIDVKSEQGKGTTFTVRLHFEEADDIAAEDTNMEKDHAPDIDLSGKKVLLCEDNALNREIAIALLKNKGISVVEVENGAIGVKKYSQSGKGEYAAILMDIRMPVMDGIEATKSIRALVRPDAKTVPIIAMTADAFPEDIQKCFDAGMNTHIAKPIDPFKLYQLLQSTLGESNEI